MLDPDETSEDERPNAWMKQEKIFDIDFTIDANHRR